MPEMDLFCLLLVDAACFLCLSIVCRVFPLENQIRVDV